MTKEQIKKCFNMFSNLKFKKEINQGGVGLGLASSHMICKMLRGAIQIFNRSDYQGCCVVFAIEAEIGDEILSEEESISY